MRGVVGRMAHHSFLAMRLKDGQQTCPRCGGQGCYWCRRTGLRQQCPQCMNQEPELITQTDGGFTCQVCECTFNSSGRLIAP